MGGCISLEIVVVYCGGAALIIGAGLVVYGGSGWNMCSICYSAVCIFVYRVFFCMKGAGKGSR